MIGFLGPWYSNNAVSQAFAKVASMLSCSEVFSFGAPLVKTNGQLTLTNGYIDFIKSNFRFRKKYHVLVPDIFSCILLSLFGFKVTFWVQGAISEESLLRNNSKPRFYLLKLLERIAFHFAKRFVFVSPYMKEYYTLRYKLNKEYLILPCLSDLSTVDVPRIKDSFCYIGGMSRWQSVDKILLLFNKIIEAKPNAKFFVATGQVDEFNQLASRLASVKTLANLHVKTLYRRQDISEFLSSMEYGFLVRENILVNQVSSPIKLAEYLSCGVNVIISDSVRSYSPLIGRYKAGVVLGENSHIDFDKLKYSLEASHQCYEHMCNFDYKWRDHG